MGEDAPDCGTMERARTLARGEKRRRWEKRRAAKCVEVTEGMFSGETGTVVRA